VLDWFSNDLMHYTQFSVMLIHLVRVVPLQVTNNIELLYEGGRKIK